MPIQPSAQLTALSVERIFRFCTCWKITRTDGVVIRLTDHDHPIVLPDGQTYDPQNGMSASARQKQQGTQSQNTETSGVVSSDLITTTDLRTGRYREAEILEFLVDWRYPWAGIYNQQRYWIEDVTYTGDLWQATLIGLTGRLRRKSGRKYTRTCDADLGDDRCGIDLEALRVSGTVGTVQEARRKFNTNLTNPRGYFNDGVLTWVTGNNANLLSEIKASLLLNGQIMLWLRTGLDIQTGDTFTIVPGCNKQPSTCRDRYNNLINFRGFDTMPGNETLLRVPNAQ